tara:strand:- start:164 stop:304 length:141 start_codon:yes stop_codon:yes gene_type:complete
MAALEAVAVAHTLEVLMLEMRVLQTLVAVVVVMVTLSLEYQAVQVL